MKHIIKRKNKTRFDYVSRTLAVISASLFLFTVLFVSPSIDKKRASNDIIKAQNTNLSNYNYDLNKEYNKLKETIKNNK